MTIQHELSYIAQKYGEEHVEQALRWWRRKLIKAGNEPTYDMSPLERLQYHAEMERADYSGPEGKAFDVTEEPDRYVMELAHISHINPADRAVISNICIRCSRIAEHIGYHEC